MPTRTLDLRPHPARDSLMAEAHSRPSPKLPLPAIVSRLVMHSGEDGGADDFEHLLQLCRTLGTAEPGKLARRHQIDAGGLTVVWERHTEFSTYTFSRAQSADQPLSWRAALEAAPERWLADLPGSLLAAVHVAIRPYVAVEEQESQIREAFGQDEVIQSDLLGGRASFAANFRMDGEGFVRIDRKSVV